MAAVGFRELIRRRHQPDDTRMGRRYGPAGECSTLKVGHRVSTTRWGLRIKNERLVRLTGVLAIALRPTDLRKRLQIAP